jgi:probable regulatory domain-containing protein
MDMVIEIQEVKVNPESLVLRILLKSIELLGGLKQLAEYRTLTWLPSLARAAYAIVLKEEYNKIEDEIAEQVGLTRQTVRNILRADPELALKKIEKMKELVSEEGKEMQVHTAGGIVKLAYKLIKEGQEESQLFVEFSSQILESISEEVPWAYRVLKAIKERGLNFPVENAQELKDKFAGLKIKDKDIHEIAEEIDYPVNNPAILLKKIKQAIT